MGRLFKKKYVIQYLISNLIQILQPESSYPRDFFKATNANNRQKQIKYLL